MSSIRRNSLVPCVIHEDDDLLVVAKPAGWNTHAPSPYAGEGIHDWLKHREPRWANLAIIHRLDKETSGVLVFGKTTLANRSLTDQFAGRTVHKTYLFVTDRPVPPEPRTVNTRLARVGDRYASRPDGEPAETRFESAGPVADLPGCTLVQGFPFTGRTHQIRVHAAECGFPILGDTLYGGTPQARVCLHAAQLALRHPASGEPVTFRAAHDFGGDARRALRDAIVDPAETTAYRLIHGASDGWPGWYADRLGDFVLSQGEAAPAAAQVERLAVVPGGGVYHKTLSRHVRGASPADSSPRLVQGEAAPARFVVRENDVAFELSFAEGYSVGLFLDQRDNRRRLLTGHVAAQFDLGEASAAAPLAGRTILNTFAYTCAFSVCAALAGAHTTSLDLSKKYLEWGARNFRLNGLDPDQHDFIYGDAFDWLGRLAKKGRRFDVVLLDPPTFSQAKGRPVFRAQKDYGKLVAAALRVLAPGGVLFASTNAAELAPEEFLAALEAAVAGGGAEIRQRHYVPQPPDFPVSRAEPAYLKTVWLRVDQKA
jgi:23S rRNA (cytosine1962-C5)-methyltransferase